MHSCLSSANSTMYRSCPPAAFACWTLDSNTVLPFALHGGRRAEANINLVLHAIRIHCPGGHASAMAPRLAVLREVGPKLRPRLQVLDVRAGAGLLTRRGIIAPAANWSDDG